MFKNALICSAFPAFVFTAGLVFAAENDNNTVPSVMPEPAREIIVKEKKSGGSFEEDYYVALKAYEDGFFDVAESSLADFLKKDSKSSQAAFATYLLYQIYMGRGDYKAAKVRLEKLEKFGDDRFDKNKLSADEMTIAVKTDCKEAKKLLLSKQSDPQMKVYIDSGCEISQDIVNYVASMPFSSDTLILAIDKIKGDKERMLAVYNNLSAEKRTPQLLNFYGHYFASNKMYTDFWRLFSEFKDPDMVDIALEDVWNSGDNLRYAEFFDKNAKGYKLDKISYCRQIEASNKTGRSFDCDIVDGCLGATNPQYKKTKLACYMKNEDKKGIATFMKNITAGEAGKLCEYGKYIVVKNLYSVDFLGKFSACPDKAGMYEALFKNKDSKGIISLAGKKREDTDKAYLALAYYISGNKAESDKYFNTISDGNLKNMVKSRAGAPE